MVTTRAARILATNYPTIDIKNFRRDQTLIFRNVFKFNDQTDLSKQFSLKSDRDGTADSPKYTLAKPKSVFWGNSKEFIVLQMDPATELDQEYLYLSVGETNATTYRSEDKIYQYYDSNASSTLGISLGLAIVYMIFAFCCWCGGMRQFYLLIRIPQMLFMLTLLATKPQAASYFSFLENFRWNLFNVIPNPVVIDEQNGNECQPAVQFFAEMLSCHVYNSLKNYVLGFLIFAVLYGFIVTNKFHDREFFARLNKVMTFHMFMLAIFPDVAIAVYLNAVAGLYNSVMSVGFFLCLLLIVWYVHIFNTAIGYYFKSDRQQLVDFLQFFVFSRSNLTVADPKLGLKFLAVMLDFVKIFIKVTMIVLFFNAPKTQLVIVFLVYILNAIFLVVYRPYSNVFQNVFYAASDVAFFIIVVLAYAAHDAFDDASMSAKEHGYGGAQAAMVFIVFFVNLFNFVIPALKGHDNQAVVHKASEEIALSDASKDKAKAEADADRPHHVDAKDAAPKDYLGKPKSMERDIHTAEARSNSRFTEGSELPLNKEEQMPMKPKESENPALAAGKRKVEIKGMAPGGLSRDHKESRPSEENLLRGDVNRSHEQLPPTSQNREQPPTAHSSQVQPRKNNLITSQVVEPGQPALNSQVQSMARLDGTPPNEAVTSQVGRSSELPPVKTGKVPIRKTFKPSNVQNQDFEGM